MTEPPLRDLAVVGDRRTVALVDTGGTVGWYCPGRLDRPALLTALLDPADGGRLSFELPGARFSHRRYVGDGAVLETTFETAEGGAWCVTDFMPMGDDLPRGLCRRFEPAPADVLVRFRPTPDYGRRAARLTTTEGGVLVDGRYRYAASHPLHVRGDAVETTIPAGTAGWVMLADDRTLAPTSADLDGWLADTHDAWAVTASRATYRGPYEREVAGCVRAIRLLTYEPTGAVAAAATTSLPEVVGGGRNYDYRYAWLRDVGMIVSALTRVGSDGREERRFLEFVCGARPGADGLPRAPFYALDGAPAPEEEELSLPGYRASRPVRIGNGARGQLQLDAYGNVLLAAKLIYNRFGTREHWDVVSTLADTLAERWREPDYGIWEERTQRQYTTGKVLAACALGYIAEHATDEAQAAAWRGAAREIRDFVERRARNTEGAYAAVVGEEAVDVSAALFPVWGYCAADTPAMIATVDAIERDLGAGGLHRRLLVNDEGAREGVFLAGSCWMAQYWVMRDPDRARVLLDRIAAAANDVGLFAEEVDPDSGELLGNLPQTFVHASFIGAAYDLKNALADQD